MVTVNDAVAGNVSNIQIFGNTVQGTDLSDIKSAGINRSDGTVEMSISCTGKNLINLNKIVNGKFINTTDGVTIVDNVNRSYIDFITVRDNISYILNHSSSATDWYVFYYDKNKNKINHNFSPTGKQFKITPPTNSKYIRITIISNGGNLNELTNIQLEEGTVTTSYEPYKSSKSTISLPCQLGNGDRLYYCNEEKAWCIDKVEVNYDIFKLKAKITNWQNGSNSTGVLTDPDLTLLQKKDNNDIRCLSTKLKSLSYNEIYSNKEVEGICQMGDSNYGFAIRVSNDKLQGKSVIDWCKDNLEVRAMLKTPQKIILPLDQQLKLNSLYGTNHIFIESGEVDATFKAIIPKSLAGSVQSLQTKTDILEEEINAIQGLKESQNMEYEMENGYLTCQSTNTGSVKDLVVPGKTLNNICSLPHKYSFTLNEGRNYDDIKICDTSKIKLGTDYTLIFKINILTNTTDGVLGKNTGAQFGVSNGGNTQAHPNMIINGDNPHASLTVGGYNVMTINVKDFKGYSEFRLRPLLVPTRPIPTGQSISYEINDLVILEGDQTQNPPSYFEGLKSFGEDVDLVEVSSVKSDGNLFDETIFTKYGLNNEEGIQINSLVNKEVIEIFEKNAQYTISFTYDRVGAESSLLLRVEYIDGSLSLYIDDTMKHVTKPNNTIKRIFFTYGVSGIAKNIKVNITKGDTYKEYEPCVLSKKHLAYYNEQNQIVKINKNTPLRQWDTFDSKKGTVTFASSQVVLNGSENIIISNDTGTNTTMFGVSSFALPSLNNDIGICDKFEYKNIFSKDEKGVYIASSGGHLYIRDSKMTVSEFKAKLQANPITITYPIATPKTYEIVDPTLDSYPGKTTVSINAGAINTKVEFAITSNINNLVKHNTKRIGTLESRLYGYALLQNRLTLNSTYSADRVTFKVDVAKTTSGVDNRDFDLFELMKSVIIAGKDNYDRNLMLEMMDFYQLMGKIDWEMWDQLNLLIEQQHKPPVIETPTK